jgi:hypothetical protein
MEIVMDRIGKHAGYYRGYLTDDRSALPLTIVLLISIALWLLVYLVGSIGPAPTAQTALRPPPHSSPVVVQSRTP